MHGDVTPSNTVKIALTRRVMGLVGFPMAAVNDPAAPGDHFVLLPKDVPRPNSTKPADFDPEFVDRPVNAMPQVLRGLPYRTDVLASGLSNSASAGFNVTFVPR